MHLELVVDVTHTEADGVETDPQFRRGWVVVVSFQQELEQAAFVRRQVVGRLPRPAA